MVLARGDKGDYAAEIIVKQCPGGDTWGESGIQLMHRWKKKKPDDEDTVEEWTYEHENQLYLTESSFRLPA